MRAASRHACQTFDSACSTGESRSARGARDAFAAHAELRCDGVERSIERLGLGTQNSMPQLLLFSGVGSIDCEAAIGSRQRQGITRAEEHQAARLLQEARDGGAGGGVFDAHEKRSTEQHRLARPQQGQCVRFVRVRRQVGDANFIQLERQSFGHPPRHFDLRRDVVTHQLDRRWRVHLRHDGGGDGFDHHGLPLGQERASLVQAEQCPQAGVEIVHAGQEVQDSLVHAQATGGRRVFLLQLEQPPESQWPHRCERAPMGFSQVRNGDAERRPWLAGRIELRTSQGQRPVHFDAGAQQQHFALENAEIERSHEHVDGRWRGQRISALREFALGSVGVVARQHTPQADEFCREQFLIGLDPAGVIHWIWIFWLNTGGVASASITGLSMPSMRRRAG